MGILHTAPFAPAAPPGCWAAMLPSSPSPARSSLPSGSCPATVPSSRYSRRCLLAAVSNEGIAARLLNTAPLRLMGDISYSVYLGQTFAFLVAVALAKTPLGPVLGIAASHCDAGALHGASYSPLRRGTLPQPVAPPAGRAQAPSGPRVAQRYAGLPPVLHLRGHLHDPARRVFIRISDRHGNLSPNTRHPPRRSRSASCRRPPQLSRFRNLRCA